jgi:hypothetical protein
MMWVVGMVLVACVSATPPGHPVLDRSDVDGLMGLLNDTATFIVGQMAPGVVSVCVAAYVQCVTGFTS